VDQDASTSGRRLQIQPQKVAGLGIYCSGEEQQRDGFTELQIAFDEGTVRRV